LAKAEAKWRKANLLLDQSQAERVRANEAWAGTNVERRHAGADRSTAGAVWNQPGVDRSKAESDRRRVGAARDRPGCAGKKHAKHDDSLPTEDQDTAPVRAGRSGEQTADIRRSGLELPVSRENL